MTDIAHIIDDDAVLDALLARAGHTRESMADRLEMIELGELIPRWMLADADPWPPEWVKEYLP